MKPAIKELLKRHDLWTREGRIISRRADAEALKKWKSDLVKIEERIVKELFQSYPGLQSLRNSGIVINSTQVPDPLVRFLKGKDNKLSDDMKSWLVINEIKEAEAREIIIIQDRYMNNLPKATYKRE